MVTRINPRSGAFSYWLSLPGLKLHVMMASYLSHGKSRLANARMRVLYITQIVPYPPHGGVLQRGYNLLRELGRELDVHLVAFHHPDELPYGEAVARSEAALREFCTTVEYLPLWPKRSAAHNALALALAAAYPKPFSVLAHRSPALSRRIREVVASNHRPDVVHLDTIALAQYRTDCGDVPVVLAHHNVESQLMHRRSMIESSWLARRYVAMQARRLERYEAVTSPRFRMNIMVSDADALLLDSISPGVRTVVIPNGVDTDYFAPRTDGEEAAVIYTGGMNMFANRDGVEWFLDEIWPRIRRECPNARFFAVGQKPSQRVLDTAAGDASVEAPGFVPDIRPWVARASVYIVPLRVGGGTRLKMVDAMAQGKAIVATRIGAEGIRGDDGRHFLLADEPDRFAAQVIRLLRDATARRALGNAARDRVVQEYGWPMLAGRLASYYASVVEGTDR